MAHVNHARIIAYDIADDKKRQQVAKLLERVGTRIQKSVFLLNVCTHTLDKIAIELNKIRDEADIIDIIPVCSKCQRHSIRLATVPEALLVFLGKEKSP